MSLSASAVYDEAPATPEEIYLKSLTKVCFQSLPRRTCASLFIFIHKTFLSQHFTHDTKWTEHISGVILEYHRNMEQSINAQSRISSKRCLEGCS